MTGAVAEPPRSSLSIDAAIERIAAGAAARDGAAVPTFPYDAVALLRASGALGWNATAGVQRPPAADELALVRAVAGADGSVGRIYDGHLNAVERLAVQAPADLQVRELAAVRAGELLVGVWGGDPRPHEGTPATIRRGRAGETLSGEKTFCSGAGGLDRALVLAREVEASVPIAVWIDLTDSGTVSIDEGWYRSAGMRASVSHRVSFDDAPVLARFGGPGGLSVQPWFGRDGLRTAASWAGMADAALAAALDELASRPGRSALDELAAGRLVTSQQTIEVWLERAARAMDSGAADLPEVALHARAAIVDAARDLLDVAARACGSHPFAVGGNLDRARRDLEVFLLQHRLEPGLARAGSRALDARGEVRS